MKKAKVSKESDEIVHQDSSSIEVNTSSIFVDSFNKLF